MVKRTRGSAWGYGVLGLGLAAAVASYAAPAHACGGFFCSRAAPVEQTGEEIVFSHNGDGTVTMIVRIQYQGPSEKFAWVLPVAGTPDVGVSSNTVFDSLRNFTRPSYTLNTTVEGQCKESPGGGVLVPGVGSPTSGAGGNGAAEDGGIDLLAHGAVGPYVYDVISVDQTLDDPAQAAVDWLTQNSYDVTAVGPDVLRPYLADGLNLIAFKLEKSPDITSGSIRPVILTYEGDQPSIPIRPTAVAAQDDMGVRVWVTASAQAVPVNYKSLVINEALVNWFTNGSNYDAVVTAAADEAGGQGFVTEMAGPTTQLQNAIYPPWQEQQWLTYSRQQFADGFEAIQQASFQFGGWDGWRDAVCGAVTLPDGLTCDEFGRNSNGYRDSVQIDETKFIRALYEDVVRPVIRARDLLLARPYFTTLYSTMSAEDMTLDPLFDLNGDLMDVSNLHVAQQIIECNESITVDQAPWRIELPQGGLIRGKGYYYTQQWPIALADGVPANFLIVQLTTSGSGKVLENNGDAIMDVLAKQASTVPGGPTQPTGAAGSGAPMQSGMGLPIGGEDNPIANQDPNASGTGSTGSGKAPAEDEQDDAAKTASSDSDGCSVSHPGEPSSGLPIALGLLLAAAVWHRRRRS